MMNGDATRGVDGDGEGDVDHVSQLIPAIRLSNGIDASPSSTSAQTNTMNGDIAGVGAEGESDVNEVTQSISSIRILDDNLPNHPQAQTMARNFAIEHRIFLRAIIDLLAERDQLATEADVNSPNTIKIGSLRKKSHRIRGLWKTKFVEIRKGTFSYFDDNAKQRGSSRNTDVTTSTAISNGGQKLLRKDLPLRAESCACRAVKIRSLKILPGNSSGGAVFELHIQGGSRRLWMANTKEERQSWIQAIHNAMIGASVTRGDNFLEYQVEQGKNGKKNKSTVPKNSPYREFLEQYLEVRGATNQASSREEYMAAISCLGGTSITVPVQWLKSQVDDTARISFLETEISLSVEQLWKDLLRDSVEINGEVVAGDSFHGPERIVGRLTQQLLSSDASLIQGSEKNTTSLKLDWKTTQISEAQAISYARDILLACDRTRSGGDSYFCAENLCLNRDLVVLCPSSTEANPLSITVSTERERRNVGGGDMKDISGWAFALTSCGKPLKRRYLVLSNGVLSCYAEAEPKPHNLLEQVILRGASISESTHNMQPLKDRVIEPPDDSSTSHVISIKSKDGRVVRDYLFEDDWDFLLWNGSLKKSASFMGEGKSQESHATAGSNGHQNSSGTSAAGATPTVDVVVNVCTEYKVCTLDPSGIESEDKWAELRTTFIQKFSLTGGPNGRISRGDEVVHLEMQA